MAEVTSGMVTVIVLNNVEASALADLLECSAGDSHWVMEHLMPRIKNHPLDDLTNAMIGMDYE